MPDQLTKTDLINMMESYKSNIEFNKQLFESQEKILADHNKVIDNLAAITSSQEKMVIHFENLVDKLSENNNTCTANFINALSEVKDIDSKLAAHNLGCIGNHGKLKSHLMAIYGALSGVIVVLSIALAKAWESL